MDTEAIREHPSSRKRPTRPTFALIANRRRARRHLRAPIERNWNGHVLRLCNVLVWCVWRGQRCALPAEAITNERKQARTHHAVNDLLTSPTTKIVSSRNHWRNVAKQILGADSTHHEQQQSANQPGEALHRFRCFGFELREWGRLKKTSECKFKCKKQM